ncbi:UDP-2,3-diacylglucosamine pyrophosphatase [Parasaccharibacter apium]|nr:UDP-2,3-diacylglucosamine pyrophosphatase [Parasaccharibacter apium]
MSQQERVGILAGGGPLPARVAASVRQQGREPFLIGFQGFVDEALLRPYPHAVMRLGAAGTILRALRAQHCRELVLIGPVKRPSWRALRPDAEGMRLIGRLGRALFAGDDGLLAAIVRLLEEEGFRIRGAHEFLTPSCCQKGAWGRIQPDEQALADIKQAVHILSVMGPLDIGQGCVVQQGLTLAVEALEGTDAMLQRCAALRQEGAGGVLVKMLKAGQELRADMPTIGPTTLVNIAEAGLRGVAFLPELTLVLDADRCIEEADRLGLFFYGLGEESPSGD